MNYIEASKLKIPRRLCSCAACGTKDLKLIRTDMTFDSFMYTIEHEKQCKKPYWYKERASINAAVKAWNDMNEEFLEGFDRIWFEVDRVYETRWDCKGSPEGVRQAA